MAKSKHPALVVDPSHPKTEINTWQLGRAIIPVGKGSEIAGSWSALHVASAEAREHMGSSIATGYFDPASPMVKAANKIGAEYASDPYRSTEQ